MISTTDTDICCINKGEDYDTFDFSAVSSGAVPDIISSGAFLFKISGKKDAAAATLKSLNISYDGYLGSSEIWRVLPVR